MPPIAPKPSSLAKALEQLTKSPVPKLATNVKGVSLRLAQRNAHYGARHFLKEELPRIAYNNPHASFNVTRKEHLKESPWPPELTVEFVDGTTKKIDMTQKHSSSILKEVLKATTPSKNEAVASTA